MTFSNGTEFSRSKTAIIVGAGPAGALMALYLAQMNWKVLVYERKDSYEQLYKRKDKGTRGTYNIVLSPRGLKALAQAKVTLPKEQIVILKGNVRHNTKEAKKSPGFSESISINRNLLAQHLFQEGINQFSAQIKYYFGHHLESIDFEQKVAIFQTEQHQVSTEFDLLVGADGVFSTVREIMLKKFDGFDCQQNQDEMTFKICQLGKVTNLVNATEDWQECFHTWPNNQPVTMLAPPNPDGSLTGILILPQQGEITFEKIKSKDDVQTLFDSKFPDIFPAQSLTQELVKDLLEQKVSFGGITTTCNTFDLDDSVVLIGDAAHSVWPSLGQGCNIALESCRVLAEILADHHGNLEKALSAYTLARKPNTDAIARMSEQGFGGNKRAVNAVFLAKVISLSILHKLLPRFFAKPALFQINNADMDYAAVETQWKTQGKQLLGIAIVLIAIVLIAGAIAIF